MNLQLKKVGAGAGKNPLVAVEVLVSATNPSSRKVYLLPNAWIVRGYKLAYRESENSESFNKLAKTTLNTQDGGYLERYSSVDSSSALAVGELFTDKWLNPNETVARTIVLHVPRNQYDVIDAATYMPSAEETRGFGFQFSIENETLVGVLCRQGAN